MSEKIVNILMERDGITKDEAKAIIDETVDEILAGDPFIADEVLMERLGLEPDYIMDLI